MKKTWMILVLLVFVSALILLLFRLTDESSTPKVSDFPGGRENLGHNVPPESSKTPNLPKKEEENYTPPISKTACLDLMNEIIASESGPGELQLKLIQSLPEGDEGRDLRQKTGLYLHCLALEKSTLDFCEVQEKFFPKTRSPIDCRTLAKIILPMKAKYHLKMEKDFFRESLAGFPEGAARWMLEFFDVLSSRSDANCARLADDPFISAVCRFASQSVSSPPENPMLKDAYFLVLAIRSGKYSYIKDKNDDPNMRMIAEAARGVPNVCSKYFQELVQGFCNRMVPADSSQKP